MLGLNDHSGVSAAAVLVTLALGCGTDGKIELDSPPPIRLEVRLTEVSVGLEVRLQAVDVLDPKVAWVSGLDGTWARSMDGGGTWESGVVPGAEGLQFRDVEAIDADRAWLLSSGEGKDSRIYFTADGGKTWQIQFQNEEPSAFYDCLASWNASTALAFSDSVNGQFQMQRTVDGEHWQQLGAQALPEAQPGEGGFAASGGCLIALPAPSPEAGSGRGFIVTGNAGRVRVLSSTDLGATWSAVDTPMPGGEAVGLTAIAIDPGSGFGVAVGGTIGDPLGPPTVLVTENGGVSFELASPPALPGALYGVSLLLKENQPHIVAVGPGGVAWSQDLAVSWRVVSDRDVWSVDFHPSGLGILVGPGGYVATVEITESLDLH